MKVINLDRFKNSQTVEFDDAKYKINGVSVDMYLNDTTLTDMENCTDLNERIKLIIEVLGKLSDIPKEVLGRQGLPMLTALLQVAQGIDPTKEDGESGEVKSPNE